jgi:hypothetical protein
VKKKQWKRTPHLESAHVIQKWGGDGELETRECSEQVFAKRASIVYRMPLVCLHRVPWLSQVDL